MYMWNKASLLNPKPLHPARHGDQRAATGPGCLLKLIRRKALQKLLGDNEFWARALLGENTEPLALRILWAFVKTVWFSSSLLILIFRKFRHESRNVDPQGRVVRSGAET